MGEGSLKVSHYFSRRLIHFLDDLGINTVGKFKFALWRRFIFFYSKQQPCLC